MKTCQACNAPLSAADLAADPYVDLCLNCWAVWEIEAGAPLRRYGAPGKKSVCTACGMVFGGAVGFNRHRHTGRCLSPAELREQKRPLALKDGIWVDQYRGNGRISFGVSDSSHFDATPATLPLPDHNHA
jgi:hypothetical protein